MQNGLFRIEYYLLNDWIININVHHLMLLLVKVELMLTAEYLVNVHPGDNNVYPILTFDSTS